MSESGDYSPGVWAGHDFGSARRAYDSHVGRSYSDAVAANKATKDLIAKDVKTNSTAPVIIVVDQTGSMGEWPKIMFSKLPYLEHETKEYLGDDAEFCFMAIGDAHNGETYPLQVRPFAKSLDLEKRLKELVIEANGGGQGTETYELAALFAAENISMPKAIKPIIIFIGDEMPYSTIDKQHAQDLCGIKLEKTLTTKACFERLKQKMAVYFIQKSYGSGSGSSNTISSDDRRCHDAWANLVGDDHIAVLPSADRVVDVIFGILAKETGRIAYFEQELEDRQLADKGGQKKVDVVYKSLVTIHQIPDAARAAVKDGTGKSVMRKSMKKLGDGTAVPSGKTMKPLI
jgi:hypothetical protein